MAFSRGSCGGKEEDSEESSRGGVAPGWGFDTWVEDGVCDCVVGVEHPHAIQIPLLFNHPYPLTPRGGVVLQQGVLPSSPTGCTEGEVDLPPESGGALSHSIAVSQKGR